MRSIDGSPLSIRVADDARYETSSTQLLQLHLINSLDETNVLCCETGNNGMIAVKLCSLKSTSRKRERNNQKSADSKKISIRDDYQY